MSKQGILADLRRGGRGIIGSFVIGGRGELVASDMPELLQTDLGKVSRDVHFLIEQLQAELGVEKIHVDTENGSLFIAVEKDIGLVSLASKDINPGLFLILTKRAITLLQRDTSEGIVEEAAPIQTPKRHRPTEVDVPMLIKADLEKVLGPRMTERIWQNQLTRLRGEEGKVNMLEVDKVLKSIQDILTLQLGAEKTKVIMEKIRGHFTLYTGSEM